MSSFNNRLCTPVFRHRQRQEGIKGWKTIPKEIVVLRNRIVDKEHNKRIARELKRSYKSDV